MNVVIVSIDSIGAGYIGQTTPFLNSVGTSFDSAISPSVWTLPVHTSVFTGRHVPEHGIKTGEESLGSIPTMGEWFSKNGFNAKAFYTNGWFDTADITRGWESNRIEEKSSSPFFRLKEWLLGQEKREPGKVTIDQSLDEMEEPFAHFIHLNDAHWIYSPPHPWVNEHTNRNKISLFLNVKYWQEKVYSSRSRRLHANVGSTSIPEKEVESFKNLYRCCVRYCDHLISELVQGMEDQGVWEDTVLVVFGDHGDLFGPIWGHHYSTSDALINVPFVIRDPTNSIAEQAPVSLLDTWETLGGILDIETPETSGVDLTSERREFAYSHYDISDFSYWTDAEEYGIDREKLPSPKQSVVWRDHGERMTVFPDGFDGEDFRDEFDRHQESMIDPQTGSSHIGADTKERLSDLGYLQ